MTFSENGYLWSGGEGGIRVWQVKDGKQMAAVEVEFVNCVAVSEDGRWIAAGTGWGDVFVWDAKTYQKVLSHRITTISPMSVSRLARLESTLQGIALKPANEYKHSATGSR